jgi:hypothetical protein
MEDTILLLLICALFLFTLALDSIFLGILRKKDQKQWELIRWPIVTGYLLPGIVFVAAGELPAEVILPPAIIASAISYYMNFIRNQDRTPVTTGRH